MVDTGFFSFPRYHAPLGELPLHEPGEHKFVFSGLPDEAMVLMLYVPGFTTGQLEQLETLNTRISARILDSEGRVVCEGGGTPNGRDSDRWVLMSSRDRAAYWHSHCNGTSFERGQHYTLSVSVSQIDPSSPHVLLQAMLEGGGVELP